MQPLDLNLLALIVGLSVYVSSIRFVVISRLISDPEPDDIRKAKYKTFLRCLIPADAAFVVSGALLLLHLYWANLFDPGGNPPEKSPDWFAPVIVWSFTIGVTWLVGHHVVSWFRTLRA